MCFLYKGKYFEKKKQRKEIHKVKYHPYISSSFNCAPLKGNVALTFIFIFSEQHMSIIKDDSFILRMKDYFKLRIRLEYEYR